MGTTKGAFFYHSDEHRREWRMTGPHLGGWEVYSLYGDERHPRRVYAGTSLWVYGTTVRHPLLRCHLYDERGAFRTRVLMYYNGESVASPPTLDLPLRPGDELEVIDAVSGR